MIIADIVNIGIIVIEELRYIIPNFSSIRYTPDDETHRDTRIIK